MFNMSAKLLASVCALAAFTSVSHASTIKYDIPNNLARNVVQNNSAVLFAEQSGVSVGDGQVTVDYLASNLTFGTANRGVNTFTSGFDLGAGTYDSFLIHFDPAIRSGSARTFDTFSFEDDIIAVILSNSGPGGASRLLNDSDDVFGAPNTDYENNNARRAERNDTFTLIDPITISVNLSANDKHIDNIRVITAPAVVPVPAAGLLLLTALGGFAIFRRR